MLIENGSNLLINSIYSIESNTALTLEFPVSAKLTNAKYIILTTMIDSISDGVNKATAQVIASEVYTEILNQWMTAQGTIDVELPTGQKIKLRTVAEMDKQLEGKLDKKGGALTGSILLPSVTLSRNSGDQLNLYAPQSDDSLAFLQYNTIGGSWHGRVEIPKASAGSTTKLMLVGDYGLGAAGLPQYANMGTAIDYRSGFYGIRGTDTGKIPGSGGCNIVQVGAGAYFFQMGKTTLDDVVYFRSVKASQLGSWIKIWSESNTTKDSNGNLKAASPIVKLFSDDFELNDESEGVEMEHLGVGHYRIKGVVGFNADGAWGINNGFVIPQDHNGKNMVLIDYEVRPDGDIEIFVFHQQNADMPERFQNKRIKHFDEEGVPVYFENYEPCDVPESRWIDMRVEMPPNSLYNQKQAEAERLAKIEAERLAQEEAKRVAEETERAEQEAAEQVEQQ
ncbi:phage tail fiber protein [Providencia sp. Me31A]|uniref:phage tail fiber protein n=2 Tax=unclassified Providencia TaxID=2633465 RepID=UPI003D2B054B